MQLAQAVARLSTQARDCQNGIERGLECHRVMSVSARDGDGQWKAARVSNYEPLRPELSPVFRVGAALLAPGAGSTGKVAALVLNWSLISLTHLKSRKAMVAAGQTLVFRSFWFPVSNWICLAFMAMVLVILAMTPGLSVSVWLVPVWLLVMWVGYVVKRRRAGAVHATR
jgi:hypothetical protein